MNEPVKLEPCPFCGGEAKFVHIFENPDKCMISCRECDGGIDAVFASEEDAEEAWNRRAQPANEPLTLDELRGMDGEPVWVDVLGDKAWWVVIGSTERGKLTTDYGGWFDFRDYGKTWLAYRTKPEMPERAEK